MGKYLATTYRVLCVKEYSSEQCGPHSPKPFLEQKSSVMSGPNCTPHPRLLGARPFYTVCSETIVHVLTVYLYVHFYINSLYNACALQLPLPDMYD